MRIDELELLLNPEKEPPRKLMLGVVTPEEYRAQQERREALMHHPWQLAIKKMYEWRER